MIEVLLSKQYAWMLAVVIAVIFIAIAAFNLPVILGLSKQSIGEGMAVTADFQSVSCSGNTLNFKLFVGVEDAGKRSMPLAPVLTVGKTTWWKGPGTAFEVVDGRGEYVMEGPMPLADEDKPKGKLFATLSLFVHPKGAAEDCIAIAFTPERGDVYGGPLDGTEYEKSLSNLITECAAHFVTTRQLAADVAC